MAIRWLHISDVHECDREKYHRHAMYAQIVAQVRDSRIDPHFVFVTGDISFSGTTKEYDSLRSAFFDELRKEISPACLVFTVPGNHDADRSAVVAPRLWITDAKERDLFNAIDDKGRRKRFQALGPRFEAYRAFEAEVADWDQDWLVSETGAACKVVSIDGAQVAIVGINTAWLCHDNEDWGQLAAGRTMVEAALDQAQQAKADLIIVLGHHPLEALTGEKPWSDGTRIRQRLEQANAIYLHGHLHTAGSQCTGGSLQNALAIQAPSAFQAGDSAHWRNGLMWGEALMDTRTLLLTPLKWNDTDREYKFDSDAGLNVNREEGRDAFRLPLPGVASEPAARLATEPRAPLGWRILSKDALSSLTAAAPDARTMIDYFDGSTPDWSIALADGIQPRQIVENTAARFRQAHSGRSRPLVELLTGAGGEGKSTALLQVTAALVFDTNQDWTCLHREATAATVPADLFETLEYREGHAWVVVLDDAENAAKSLAEALGRIAPRTDVHLLLAARETDWTIRGITRSLWQDVAEFRQQAMPGLDEQDARRIVEGWRAFGEDAMGRIGGSVETAAKALHSHATEYSARPGEGALLGALLFTRQGESLKDRVRAFVAPLDGRGGTGSFDLRDIYAAIAAMHAENQLYLSRDVLAASLGCDDTALDDTLRILRRETMLDSGDTHVLTRHRRIAETAISVLEEDGYNVARWYPALAKAAEVQAGVRRQFTPEIAQWRFDLANHFIERGEPYWNLARKISAAIYEANPNDPKRLVTYVNVLRQAGAHGEAMTLLKQTGEAFRNRRDVLYEWSVIAGAIDNGLAIWLAGRSLAEDSTVPLNEKDCKVGLAGLGRAFELLSKSTRRQIFGDASAACGHLGLRLPGLDGITERYFKGYIQAQPDDDLSHTPEDDMKLIQRAVSFAANETEPDSDVLFFERLLGEPENYRYSSLLAAVTGPRPPRAT